MNIWTFFIAVLALFITTSTATVYTRDQLLSLASSAVQLDQQYHSSGYVDEAAGLGGVGTAS